MDRGRLASAREGGYHSEGVPRVTPDYSSSLADRIPNQRLIPRYARSPEHRVAPVGSPPICIGTAAGGGGDRRRGLGVDAGPAGVASHRGGEADRRGTAGRSPGVARGARGDALDPRPGGLQRRAAAVLEGRPADAVRRCGISTRTAPWEPTWRSGEGVRSTRSGRPGRPASGSSMRWRAAPTTRRPCAGWPHPPTTWAPEHGHRRPEESHQAPPRGCPRLEKPGADLPREPQPRGGPGGLPDEPPPRPESAPRPDRAGRGPDREGRTRRRSASSMRPGGASRRRNDSSC